MPAHPVQLCQDAKLWAEFILGKIAKIYGRLLPKLVQFIEFDVINMLSWNIAFWLDALLLMQIVLTN